MASTAPSEEGVSRRARNKARTHAAILDASLTCIAEAGVQATTMDQIAAAADVSRATLFNYFPSKHDIVDALVTGHDAGFFVAVDTWRRTPGLTIGEKLLGLFSATAHYLRRAPARHRALIGLSWLHWAEPRSVARIRRVREAFVALLDDGRAGGDIAAGIDTRLAADVICNTYMGILHSWWMEEDHSATDRFDGAARLLATMISPGAALPARAPILSMRGSRTVV